MRRSQRLIAATVAIALCTVLAGCGGGLNNFDPSDMLDFLDTKKKLPGERKPVFPDGVPGLDQGVPKELYKGARQDQVEDPNAQAAAAPPTEPPKSKKSAKGKGSTHPRAAASTAQPADASAADAEAAPAEEGAPAALPPEPKPKKMARKRTTALPPDQPAAEPTPAPSTQQSAAPFSAPLPSGSFTR
jgi:hypothetical protein